MTTPPTTITPTLEPPPLGDLSLSLTAAHAAAASGDLDRYTTALHDLHRQTGEALRALGGFFVCDHCDTSIDLADLTLATPTPPGWGKGADGWSLPVDHAPAVAPEPANDSPAGRLAVLAALAEALAVPAGSGTSAHDSATGLQLNIHSRRRLDHVKATVNSLRRATEVLGVEGVSANTHPSGTVAIEVTGLWRDRKVEVTYYFDGDRADPARAWLAELGVKVRP